MSFIHLIQQLFFFFPNSHFSHHRSDIRYRVIRCSSLQYSTTYLQPRLPSLCTSSMNSCTRLFHTQPVCCSADPFLISNFLHSSLCIRQEDGHALQPARVDTFDQKCTYLKGVPKLLPWKSKKHTSLGEVLAGALQEPGHQ